MTVLRILSVLIAVILAVPASATIFPYQSVQAFGRNNLRDVSHLACDFIEGCYDREGNLCADDPNSLCILATVPPNRCSKGSNSVPVQVSQIWPARGGFCAGTTGFAHGPNGGPDSSHQFGFSPLGTPCLPDAYIDIEFQILAATDAGVIAGLEAQLAAIENTDGNSAMCGGASCDMSRNDNSVRCNGTDPTAPNFETIKCGGPSALCSDGDPSLDVGGFGVALCVEVLLESLGQRLSNCGSNAGEGDGDLGSPRNDMENTQDLFTAQRKPGTGTAVNVDAGAIVSQRTTFAIEMEDANSAPMGVRSWQILGDSNWADYVFSSSTKNGALDSHVSVQFCNPPAKWETQLPAYGFCTNDNDVFCIQDTDCASVGGICDASSFVFCHETSAAAAVEGKLPGALDSVGFIWTQDLDVNDPIPAGAPAAWDNGVNATCPPFCGTSYDFHTYEEEEIVQTGLQDRNAGIQLLYDSLEGDLAQAGDAITVTGTRSVAWVGAQMGDDLRCFLGGQDPNDTINLGTCSNTLDKCDPCTRVDIPCTPQVGSLPCGGGAGVCDFCGGTHTSQLPGGRPVDANVSGLALPVGYNDHGFSVLGLAQNRRIGLLNNRVAEVDVPIFVAGVTGAASAEFRDDFCDAQNDSCSLGQTNGGGPGIGSARTFPAGADLPIGVAIGANAVNVDAENAGTPLASPAPIRTTSYGPGANGIPGCIGNNSSANNGNDACKGRFGFGTQLENWGTCTGGFRDGEPCQESAPINDLFACNSTEFASGVCENPVLGFNTGGDDSSLPVSATFVSGATDGIEARFKVPNPSDPAPTIHTVSALSLRDLAIRAPTGSQGDNADVIVKVSATLCPLNQTTGVPECVTPGPPTGCVDTDADGICDDGDNSGTPGDNTCVGGATTNCDDNCRFISNPAQEDTAGVGLGPPPPDGIGNACQCGDVNGDAKVDGLDSILSSRVSVGLPVGAAFSVPANCDVNGDNICNGLDAILISRASVDLPNPASVTGKACPGYTNVCTVDAAGNCLP